MAESDRVEIAGSCPGKINSLVSIIMSSRVRECAFLAQIRNPLTVHPTREGWDTVPTCRQAATTSLRVAIETRPLHFRSSAFGRNTECDAAPSFRPTTARDPCSVAGIGTTGHG